MIGLDDLVAHLRGYHVELDADEWRDALWLANRLPRIPASLRSAPAAPRQVPEARPTESVPEAAAPVPQPEPLDSPQPQSTDTSSSASLYLPQTAGSPSTATTAGIPLATPAVNALPDASQLLRALRPLRLRVPSRRHFELDEQATAHRVATERLWLPVMRPVQERWLSLAIVVDASSSMALWHRDLQEFRRLLQQLCAFQSISCWNLDSTADTGPLTIQNGLEPSPSGGFRQPQELLDPAGRRLIWLISDTVGAAWRDGRIARLLAIWEQSAPVVLLHVLPRHLWLGTAAGDMALVSVSSRRRGVPNRLLQADKPDRRRQPPSASTYVPVATLEANDLGTLARFLAGDVGAHANALRWPMQPLRAATTKASPGGKLEAQQRIARFDVLASPLAQRLARLLSVVPLSLPVMRLVQQTVLPGAERAHLAEFFLGGLIEQVGDDNASLSAESRQYDFFPGVRELLAQDVGVSESIELLKLTSGFVRDQLGHPFDFAALLADPDSHAQGPQISVSSANPFAQVAGRVLLSLGGKYAALSHRLQAHAAVQAHANTGASAGARANAAEKETSPELPKFNHGTSPSGEEGVVAASVTPPPSWTKDVERSLCRVQIGQSRTVGCLVRRNCILIAESGELQIDLSESIFVQFMNEIPRHFFLMNAGHLAGVVLLLLDQEIDNPPLANIISVRLGANLSAQVVHWNDADIRFPIWNSFSISEELAEDLNNLKNISLPFSSLANPGPYYLQPGFLYIQGQLAGILKSSPSENPTLTTTLIAIGQVASLLDKDWAIKIPSMSEVSRSTLRRLLGMLLRTSVDLDAFILDYFPIVYRRVGTGMDRTIRENLLLTLVEPNEIISALRASSGSDELRQIDAVLRVDSAARDQSQSERPEPRDEPAPTQPPLLFLEYAEQDERMLQALETHLLPAERDGRLRIFHRGRIAIGDDVQKEFARRLAQAAVIVPLLSADLLGGAGFEPFLREAQRRQADGALIVPLIMRPVMWEHTPLGGLKALPADGRPLAARPRASDRDAELVSIAGSLLKQAQSVRAQPSRASDIETRTTRANSAAPMGGLPTSYILHLSDLHFSSPAQLGPWLDRLDADLDEIRGKVPVIHGIVISGDLTYKATAAEFRIAGHFLLELRKIRGLEGPQIVLVPGNHDCSWELSRAAYAPDLREDTAAPGSEPVSQEIYARRFEAFAQCYHEVVGSPYPLAPEKQATLHPFPEHKLLFLGLNSAWQCDHLVDHRGRVTINEVAFSVALRTLRREKKYEDWLKIAVFHHPVQSDGEDRIKNTGFLDRLAQAGFRLALHGHMHAAQQLQHAYDSTADGRKLRVVGVGTFGAPTKEWLAGVPLQYQILCIGGSKVTVRSRCRTNPEGTWQADGRWRVGDDVRAFYEINL